MPEVLGVTGMPLAGKTTAADILEEQGYEKVDMGDVVRSEMDARDIPVERTAEFVNSQREAYGRSAIARLTVPRVQNALEDSEEVVVTGMRSAEERDRFQKELGIDMDVVAVWASVETRRRRMEDRGREEDEKSQDFEERDQREIEHGVAELVALSDHLIKNESGGESELRHRVESLG
nr:MAG: dephospho-CoA kinase [Candidatus Nanosalinarum sp. J07AB56]